MLSVDLFRRCGHARLAGPALLALGQPVVAFFNGQIEPVVAALGEGAFDHHPVPVALQEDSVAQPRGPARCANVVEPRHPRRVVHLPGEARVDQRLQDSIDRRPGEARQPPANRVVDLVVQLLRAFAQERKTALFITAEIFGKFAEKISTSRKKGDGVLIKGRLDLNEWTGNDGRKRQTYRVFADDVKFLERFTASDDEPADDESNRKHTVALAADADDENDFVV